MRLIKTILVDDEDLARERLRKLLKPHSDIVVIGEASDGEEALAAILEQEPDLVFLDIQMPGCSGVEVAASLPSGKPSVIFCTAFDEYAIEAFELNAVDYLLKPVNRSRMAKALERVRGGGTSEEALENAVRSIRPTRFVGKKGSRYKVVQLDDVEYFLSDGGLTQLWTAAEFLWMEPSLSDLENRLHGGGFYRVSRQAIVNLNKVEEVIPTIGGHGQVKLVGGKILEVSRRKLKGLLDELQEGD